jgi:hypothetical protein
VKAVDPMRSEAPQNRDQNRKGGPIVLTPKKKYLNSYQVAEWLGYAPRTITEWAEQWPASGGQEGIPAFKIGRSWRIDADVIQQWLTQKQALDLKAIA